MIRFWSFIILVLPWISLRKCLRGRRSGLLCLGCCPVPRPWINKSKWKDWWIKSAESKQIKPKSAKYIRSLWLFPQISTDELVPKASHFKMSNFTEEMNTLIGWSLKLILPLGSGCFCWQIIITEEAAAGSHLLGFTSTNSSYWTWPQLCRSLTLRSASLKASLRRPSHCFGEGILIFQHFNTNK